MGAVAMGIDRIDHSALVAIGRPICLGLVHRRAILAGAGCGGSAANRYKMRGGIEAEGFVWVGHLVSLSICAQASATVRGTGLRPKAYAVPLFGAIPIRRQSSPRLMPRRCCRATKSAEVIKFPRAQGVKLSLDRFHGGAHLGVHLGNVKAHDFFLEVKDHVVQGSVLVLHGVAPCRCFVALSIAQFCDTRQHLICDILPAPKRRARLSA